MRSKWDNTDNIHKEFNIVYVNYYYDYYYEENEDLGEDIC